MHGGCVRRRIRRQGIHRQGDHLNAVSQSIPLGGISKISHVDISEEDFDALVEEALEALPEQLLAGLDNVAIVVEDEPEDGSDTLGFYEGIALTERDDSWFGALPDRVVLFRGPLSRMCSDEDELFDEIAITLVHEIGHYHGIDEERLHELGWG